MNEYEIETAAGAHALHPVLGPATRTLASLMAWTNANSDGWPYWAKPRQAAAKLTALIEAASWHERDSRYAAPTADAYKAALRPVKAFRTRQANDRGLLDRETLFEIIEPGAGVGGEVWALAQVVRDAEAQWRRTVAACEAARELLDRARDDLHTAQRRQNLNDLRARAAAGDLTGAFQAHDTRLAQFAVGDRLWLLPGADQPGVGEPAVVTGLEIRAAGSCLTYRTPAGRTGQEYRPMALADARTRFWILDANWSALVAGGWADEQRTARAQADRYPDCVVVQGSRFMPDPANLTDIPVTTS